MTKLSHTLRKAAILISALDDGAADALLEQMEPEEAAKVRSALVELDDIPAHEQQLVLGEFLRQQGTGVGAATGTTGGVELELHDDVEVPRPGANSDRSREEARVRTLPPFAFLHDVPPRALADVLRREHPQTGAFVIASLPPQQAADVLEALPPDLATEALGRMAWLGEVSAEVQADLERELQRQLDRHRSPDRPAQPSLARVTAVLDAMEASRRQRVVAQLAARSATLASQLGAAAPGHVAAAGPQDNVTALRYRIDSAGLSGRGQLPAGRFGQTAPLVEFEDLALLNDAGLRMVFAAADIELLLLALTGAEAPLQSRILHCLPTREAAVLRQRLDHPGPLRLRDIDRAQQEIAAIASRLARDGRIVLPRPVSFAAAA